MEENEGGPQEPSPATNDRAVRDDCELALKRYDVVMRYLASDNAIYWTRSQLLLVAHAALLGFLGNQLKDVPADLGGEQWYKLIALAVEPAFGLCLCVIWYFAIKGGRHWMDRWEKILTDKLEAGAFGDIEIYRNALRPKPRTRNVAWMTLGLFACLWSAALCLAFCLIAQKMSMSGVIGLEFLHAF